MTETLKQELQQKIDKEVGFLQNVKDVLMKAKQELNNDLTKLAIRNLPMLAQSEIGAEIGLAKQSDQQTANVLDISHLVAHQQPSNEESRLNPPIGNQNIQQLEPLDLDIE